MSQPSKRLGVKEIGVKEEKEFPLSRSPISRAFNYWSRLSALHYFTQCCLLAGTGPHLTLLAGNPAWDRHGAGPQNVLDTF